MTTIDLLKYGHNNRNKLRKKSIHLPLVWQKSYKCGKILSHTHTNIWKSKDFSWKPDNQHTEGHYDKKIFEKIS